MENIWGRLKEPQNINLYIGASSDEVAIDITKSSIRQKVWEFMERNDIANFPRPVYNRIPNFKGASAAGDKVSNLPEFRDAKVIKVNPDKPQEEVRFRALDAGKTLIVPTPRLTQGLFNRLEAEPSCTKESLRKMSSRYGIDSLSKPVPMASRLKLDLVVIGSVAVDRLGRRIGKGEGFADLEWAMAASHHSAVTQDTVVISAVHDVQVFDEMPQSLFTYHDLPVDIIVTPTQVIRVSNRLKKPDHIQWDILTREKFNQIGILKEIQFREKKAGNSVKLADGFEDVGPIVPPNDLNGEANARETNGLASDSENTGKLHKGREGKYSRRNNGRRGADKRATNIQINKRDNEDGQDEHEEEVGKGHPARKKHQEKGRNKRNFNNRNMDSIGIFVGRIPRTARVKELKDAIQERGLRTNNLVWKGVKGFAFLYFDKTHTNMSEEEICLQLKDLKLGDSVLNIEPDKRKEKARENMDNEASVEQVDLVNTKAYKEKTTPKDKNNKPTYTKPRDGENEIITENVASGECATDVTTTVLESRLDEKTPEAAGEEQETFVTPDSSRNSEEKSNISQISVENGNNLSGTGSSELESKMAKIEITDSLCSDIIPEEHVLNASPKEDTVVGAPVVKNNIPEDGISSTLTADADKGNSETKDSTKSDELTSKSEDKTEKDNISKETTKCKLDETQATAEKEITSPRNGDMLEVQTNEKESKSSAGVEEVIKQNTEITPNDSTTDIVSPKKTKGTVPQAKESENKLKGSQPDPSSVADKKATCTKKTEIEKEKVKPTTIQAKKDEKAIPKVDASTTKKEKSKSPDKEVKKEEGSGGGFFKRFWK